MIPTPFADPLASPQALALLRAAKAVHFVNSLNGLGAEGRMEYLAGLGCAQLATLSAGMAGLGAKDGSFEALVALSPSTAMATQSVADAIADEMNRRPMRFQPYGTTLSGSSSTRYLQGSSSTRYVEPGLAVLSGLGAAMDDAGLGAGFGDILAALGPLVGDVGDALIPGAGALLNAGVTAAGGVISAGNQPKPATTTTAAPVAAAATTGISQNTLVMLGLAGLAVIALSHR